MRIDIRTNAGEVLARIRSRQAGMQSGLDRAIRKAGLLVERFSKIRAPVRTGRLRASIRADIRPLVAEIAPHVNYAIFVHDGTSRMRARPFMNEGYENASSEIMAVFEREIQGVLR